MFRYNALTLIIICSRFMYHALSHFGCGAILQTIRASSSDLPKLKQRFVVRLLFLHVCKFLPSGMLACASMDLVFELQTDWEHSYSGLTLWPSLHQSSQDFCPLCRLIRLESILWCLFGLYLDFLIVYQLMRNLIVYCGHAVCPH